MGQEQKQYEIGCIVGRFQIHELHAAHRDLIDQVISKHKKVILFLGVSRITGTRENPLDFTARKKMIQAHYPEINIIPLMDQHYDDVWSKNLDTRIREVYQMGSVVLYGGRDSFIPSYKGQFDTRELEQTIYISGTEIRNQISEDIMADPNWRAGVIYNSYNRYPISYQTVDIACINDKRNELLLCKKPGESKYRFIGGFVDPTDKSLEYAARREFGEETGGNAEASCYTYVGSFRVDDWRYRKGRDKIMTTLFKCLYIFGQLEPSDDISELKWFHLDEVMKEGAIPDIFVEEHVPLAMELVSNLKSKKPFTSIS